MSNYPPGVTGSEYQIAGPDYEREVDEKCQVCGSPQMEQGYRHERWLVCSDGHVTDLEPLEPDPDRKRDLSREEQS